MFGYPQVVHAAIFTNLNLFEEFTICIVVVFSRHTACVRLH